MGGSSSGGRQDAGPNRTVAQKYTPPKAIGVDKFGNTITSTSGNYKTINESGKTVGSSFISEGGNKSNKDIDKMFPSGTKVLASIAKPLLAKGAKYNRKTFENFVIGSEKTKGIASTVSRKQWDAMSNAKKESLYGKHQKSRMSGKTDFYGRDVVGEGGRPENIINKNIGGRTIQTTAPTTAEISQATATNASSSYSSNATLLANNKKGRRSTILDKATGLGNSNLNTTKKTLGA